MHGRLICAPSCIRGVFGIDMLYKLQIYIDKNPCVIYLHKQKSLSSFILTHCNIAIREYIIYNMYDLDYNCHCVTLTIHF